MDPETTTRASSIGRATFLKGVAAATAVAAAPGLASAEIAEAQGRVEVPYVKQRPSGQATIWSSAAFPAARVAAFNKVYPDVKIVQRSIPGAGSDASNATTVATALLTGVGAPDGYYFMEDSLYPQYADALYDVGPFIAPYIANIVPYKLAAATQRGRVVAVSYDVTLSLLTYRADIVAKAGVDMAHVRTYDDLIAAAQQMRKRVPSCSTPLFFMRGGRFPVFTLEGLAWQQHSGMIDAKGALQLNTKPYAQAFSYFKKAARANLVAMAAPLEPGLWSMWNKGQTCFVHFADWWTGWLGPGLKPIWGKLAVAPQPVFSSGDSPYSIMGGSAYIVPQRAKRPDLGALFGAFMMLDRRSYLKADLANFDTILPSEESLYPYTKVVRKVVANGASEHDLLVKAALNAPTSYRYPAWYARTYDYIRPNVEAVLTGQMSARDAQNKTYQDVLSKVVQRYR